MFDDEDDERGPCGCYEYTPQTIAGVLHCMNCGTSEIDESPVAGGCDDPAELLDAFLLYEYERLAALGLVDSPFEEIEDHGY